MKNYNALRKKYPEFISLDQLYRICNISKKSARYLIQHHIIPSIDTGHKTWRYKIAIEDVITYLKQRDKVGSMIPPGAASSKSPHAGRKHHNRKSFSEILPPGQESLITEYFAFIYADCDEILTAMDIVEMTGLPKSTVLDLLKQRHIKSLESRPRYIVPKVFLLEFVASRRFVEARTQSETFIKILGGFEIWKTAKSSQ